MKRSDLVKMMVQCWDTSKGMGYTNLEAMDRVLEMAEENGMVRCLETTGPHGEGITEFGFEEE